MPADHFPASVVTGANRFSLDLYQRLARRASDASLFASPFSILGVLAMTCAGARGQTAEQMRQALALPDSDASLHLHLGSLASGLQSQPGLRLEFASSLWPQSGFRFEADYLNLLQNAYQAALTPLDFANQAEAARQLINTWAEDHTAGKIRDLLMPGSLTPLTRLVLVNAIYFKGTWEKTFDPQLTREDAFTRLDGSLQPLLFMRQKLETGYAQTETVQVLSMPFEGAGFEMVFLLPAGRGELRTLEDSLQEPALARLFASLRTVEVQVQLPIFRLETAFDLKPALTDMGMKDAFDRSQADFSGMTGQPDLFISDAVHKAFLEVNEEGAEAAAASAVVMAMRAAARHPLVFRADHPFMFLIRQVATGLVLFTGRYCGES